MGSWDCYCALCGCPLSSRDASLGSRNPYALAARRNRVARIKRRQAGENVHETDAESLNEVKRLEEALRREEPGKRLHDYDWQNGYDPEIVTEKDVEWLGTCRSLGRNIESGKAYLTPRGYYEDYGGFALNETYENMSSEDLDPNDPKTSYLTCYNTFDNADENPVFPFHEACYTILARALYNDPDTTRIDKDALYTTIILHEQVDGRYNSLSLDYGHFDNSEQFWLSNAGYEYLVCDPSLDPAISAKVQSMLPPQLFTSAASTPNVPSKGHHDPFATLPYDILHLLVTPLTTSDILSLNTASSHVQLQTHIPTFWKSMIVTRILPWFPELEDLCTTVLFASSDIDLKKVFLWLDSVTKPAFGMQGPFVRIANRRRILNAVQDLVPAYLDRIQD